MRSFFFTALVSAIVSSCSQTASDSASTPTPAIGAPAGALAPAAAPPAAFVSRHAVPIDGLPTIGEERALVTIVEFTDYDCPFCTKAEGTMKRLAEKYGADLRFVIAQHPLPMHEHARDEALYALALGGDAFASRHALLFATQSSRLAAPKDDTAADLGISARELDDARASTEAQRSLARAEALATKLQVRGTPSFFVNGRKIVGAQPFDTFDAMVREELAHARDLVARGVAPSRIYQAILDEAAAHPAPLEDPEPDVEAVPGSKDVGGAPLFGSERAKKTIVLFTDFECPYCKRLDARLRQLTDGDGDVRVVLRHAPLPMHPHARLAAKAAVAADAQGKLTAYAALLFAHQDALDRDALLRYAVDAGLDRARFVADLDGAATEARLAEDEALAHKLGVKGTPTSFADGKRIVGAQPLDTFRRAIVQ